MSEEKPGERRIVKYSNFLFVHNESVRFFFSAKPVHNLALRVLQSYYAELCEGLSSDPHQMARDLYTKGFIGVTDRNKVLEAQGLHVTSFDKATILVTAVERMIATDNRTKPLIDFCRLLERRPVVGRISARMKARLGECVAYLF